MTSLRDVCLSCWQLYHDPRSQTCAWQDSETPIYSISRYQGAVRKLILGAKARRHCQSLAILCEWSLADQTAREWATWADLIIPAPSSLWSRIRGNCDPAWHIAHILAKYQGKTLGKDRSAQAWRWRKQVRRRERLNLEKIESLPSISTENAKLLPDSAAEPSKSGQKNVLLVDDVITTGTTILTMQQSCNAQNFQFRALVFARAGAFAR